MSILTSESIYFLSFGSNLGDKVSYLKQALELLANQDVCVLKASSLYQTQPVDFKAQPEFLNQAVKIRARLAPSELLRAVKKIEKECRRKKTARFGPRTLDMDILWWDGGCVKRKNLTIPHPRAAQRKFVLVPWAEIAGKNFMLQGKSLSEWMKLLDKNGEFQKVKRYDG